MLPWKQGRHRRALRPGTWAHIQGSPLPRTVPRPHALSQLCLQDFAYEELTRTLKAPLIRRLRGPLRTGKGVCLETFIQSKHSKNYYDCPVSMATLIYNELHGYGGFTEPPGLDGGKHTPTSEEAAPALPQGPRRAGRRPLGADPRGPLRGAHPRRAPDRAVPSALLRRHGDSAPVGVTQRLAALASLYHQSHETRQRSRVKTSWARPRSPGTMSPRSPVTASKFHRTRPAHRPSHLLVRRSRRRRRRFRSHLCCCPDEDTASRSHWMTFSKRGG